MEDELCAVKFVHVFINQRGRCIVVDDTLDVLEKFSTAAHADQEVNPKRLDNVHCWCVLWPSKDWDLYSCLIDVLFFLWFERGC